MSKTRFTSKSTPNTKSLTYTTTALFPYQPARDKNYLRLSTSNFYIRFSFFCRAPRVSTFCLPADEATAKSATKTLPQIRKANSHVVCKDKRIFLTKPLLCQKQNKVSQDPARAGVDRYARNGACLVCVCVCLVCVCVCVCV